MGLLATAPLMMFASLGPIVTPLDGTRFQVRIVYDDRSVAGHANAQFSLRRAAETYCKGKGIAISERTLEVDKAEPLKRNKPAIGLSEVYACRARD